MDDCPAYAYTLDELTFFTETAELSIAGLCMRLASGAQREEPCDVRFAVHFFDGATLSGWFDAERLEDVRVLVREMQTRAASEQGPTGMATDVKAALEEIVAAAVASAFAVAA